MLSSPIKILNINQLQNYIRMKLFDVYPLYNIEPVRGDNFYVFDKDGNKFLDFYGGHAVISIGHSRPYYIKHVSEQLNKIAFYSNFIINNLQIELSEKLGKISGYNNYQLFLCNSGAEANENALKLASFHTDKKKTIAFSHSFHGRTSLAVATSDNKKIVAPINQTNNVIFIELNDIGAFRKATEDNEVGSVIIEGIQGIGGINTLEPQYLEDMSAICKEKNIIFIIDEIQSGYGRSGKFFAHQYSKVKPDIISIAKGMGNGFPIGGILIAPHIKAQYGMLGTTFGGNHLACSAAIAVLDVMEFEKLIENANIVGEYLISKLKEIDKIKIVKGIGLMLGIVFDFNISELRKRLVYEYNVFTGSAKDTNMIRLLPPLTIGFAEVDIFIDKLKKALN